MWACHKHTVRLRIEDIVMDIQSSARDQILQPQKTGPESVDIVDIPQLIVYARYNNGNDIKEEFLFCPVQLQTTTKGKDIFRVLDTNLTFKLEWVNCIGVCTDGARSMTENKSGFVVQAHRMAPYMKLTLCIIQGDIGQKSTSVGPSTSFSM